MSIHLYIWDFVSTLWVKYTESILNFRFVILKVFPPLFFRFIFFTSITSLWPVDFPFKILISGNHTGFQFIHPNHPFFQKIIQNPIVKPYTDRSMNRPAVIVMVVNGSVSYFIAFFTRNFRGRNKCRADGLNSSSQKSSSIISEASRPEVS